jgi:hypothetical protein
VRRPLWPLLRPANPVLNPGSGLGVRTSEFRHRAAFPEPTSSHRIYNPKTLLKTLPEASSQNAAAQIAALPGEAPNPRGGPWRETWAKGVDRTFSERTAIRGKHQLKEGFTIGLRPGPDFDPHFCSLRFAVSSVSSVLVQASPGLKYRHCSTCMIPVAAVRGLTASPSAA